ncbi:outer membrane lipase/esterase [Chitinivorax tropicus]|uniref:Outer membrane lipase/esterase n=1 Tax=Chitinivorax tropicus TaxID=714531 RepID=A0A840MKA7_9PROT|nr:autotransporter domain-containing protein [Chitinivorax tropicus]MBB5019088.1 outer membrane lipase/esterase [Chitinivorax tropicus]
MKKFVKPLIALAVASSFSGAAQADSYSQMYVFGDSLSDTGAFAGGAGVAPGARFTVNPGLVYVDRVAEHYGKSMIANNRDNPNTPRTGNNYAQGGARSIESDRNGLFGNIHDLPTQVTNALDDFKARNVNGVDPNALYIMYTGGNDVPVALAKAASNPADAAAEIQASATSLLTQVARLRQAGAKTIVVPNLPNFANVPGVAFGAIDGILANSAVATGITNAVTAQVDAGIAAGSIPAANRSAAISAGISTATNAIRTAAVNAMFAQYRASDDPTTARNNAAAAAQAAFTAAGVPLPDGTVATALARAAAGGKQLSEGFNLAVSAGMITQGINVIPADIFHLVDEVVADSKLYGIDNVTGAACPNTLVNSIQCSANTPGVDSSKTYLFADDRHPTPQMHALIADYLISILDAGNAIAPLVDLQLAGGRAHEAVIDNHLRSLAGTRQSTGGYRVFVDAGSTRMDRSARDTQPRFDGKDKLSATVGFDVLATDNVNIGFAVSRNEQAGQLSGSGRVQSRETTLSVFGQADLDNWYVNWLGSIGNTNFDKIERAIKLGAATRIENGNAKADRTQLKLGLGYRMPMGPIKLIPKAGLAYQNIDIAAYQEGSGRSTAMTFSSQKVKSVVGSLGLAVEGNFAAGFGQIRPYLDLAGKHEFKGGDRKLTVGLVNMPGGFDVQIARQDDSYGTVGAGVNVDIGRATTVGLNYQQVIGMRDSKERSAGLSLLTRF